MLSVSIIIPYFDREHTIRRCLESIKIGQHLSVEVIIVDDHSDIPLENDINSLITVVRLGVNMGPVAARSHGASYAKHDYLMFLDSDDELLPEWYASLSNVITKNPTTDFLGFPDSKYGGNISHDLKSSDDYWKWVPLTTRASDYLIVITASAYKRLPMPKLRISEIWYLAQLFEVGLTAHYSEKPIFTYHQDSGNQLSKRRFSRFKTSKYIRKSLLYSIKVFNKNEDLIKRHAKTYYYAWLKRFFKESVLSMSIVNLGTLLRSKHEVLRSLSGKR